METTANSSPLASAPASAPAPASGLYGPWADVLLLGGGSLLALIVLRLLNLSGEAQATLVIVMLVLANVVNHPHFAFSYQMFYGSWREVKDGRMAPDLRRRWFIAGFIAPALLGICLLVGAISSANGESFLLAITLTSMGLLVGWHYVKQGFGMAMMDAALKKRYWPADTRKALLTNAYACWVAAWAIGNSTSSATQMWGVIGLSYSVPMPLVVFTASIAGLTTIWCALAVYRTIGQWRAQNLSWKQWPAAGLIAYLITLYLWIGLISIDMSFLLVIPFFHSLQYLTVVSRYKVNEARVRQFSRKQMAGFVVTGTVLGALGFWILPIALDYVTTGRLPTQGVTLALACAWIFINVHHYLIDNVLWRQGNPNVKQYLFDAQPR